MPDNSNILKKKILLIEDDIAIRALYARVLKDQGYEVEEAGDGQLGFEKMKEGGYDLVLLDVMLPKLDGLGILAKLKNEPSIKPNKAIVIVTNLDQDVAVAQAGQDFGVAGYLVKSHFAPSALKEEVKKYLG